MSEPTARPDLSTTDRLADSLELLADMGRDFAASLDLEETLQKALRRITDYLDAAGGALFLLTEDGTQLRCEASVGETEITGVRLKSDQGIVGRSVKANKGEVIRDAQNDPAFHGSVDAETGTTTRSILCAPLSVKEERIGAIELINRLSADGMFTEDDLNLLEILASSAALAILNARMAAALVEQERMRRELELAAEIQRNLLPPPPGDDFPIHGLNLPARTVSGDFYDFFRLADGRIAFCLGDVSGKGMNAALLMAKTASLFRCLGKTILDPGRLLQTINAEICETATRGMFITMVVGLYDPRTRHARLANAGHEPPLVHARDGGFEPLPAEAPPIGISPKVVGAEGYPEDEIDLAGRALYVFTDGVTEGRTEDGGMLEADGLKALIAAHAARPLGDRLDHLVARIDQGDAGLHDDVTLLVIDPAPEGSLARDLGEAAAPADAPGERLLRLRVPALAVRLKEIRARVAEAAAAAGGDADFARDVVTAVDEACQNIIRHAYGPDADGDIVIEILKHEDRLFCYLRDFADTVDRNKIKPRDLGDVRPGGLGTHFIRTIMDEVAFWPPPGGRGNLLRLVKSI